MLLYSKCVVTMATAMSYDLNTILKIKTTLKETFYVHNGDFLEGLNAHKNTSNKESLFRFF